MTLALSKLPTGMQLTDSETVIVWFGCFGLFTLLSNLYSVVMIAWKAWCVVARSNCIQTTYSLTTSIG